MQYRTLIWISKSIIIAVVEHVSNDVVIIVFSN